MLQNLVNHVGVLERILLNHFGLPAELLVHERGIGAILPDKRIVVALRTLTPTLRQHIFETPYVTHLRHLTSTHI